jgi:hypothetical protein
MKPDPPANEPEAEETLESSEGSSKEERNMIF